MTRQIKVITVVIGVMALALILTTPAFGFAEGEHENEGAHEEHHFDWYGFIGKTINALILFGGIILLLRKPLIKILAQKSTDIKTDIELRENEVEKTTNELEKIHKRLEKIEEEVAGMKQTAEESGDQEKKQIEELGAKEAQRILEVTEAEINTKVENSIRNLKAKIADLTIEHFKTDIQKQLDKKAHEKIIEKNIQKCGEIIERD
jgi:F0F1-type ATP synthase membrane subunit b/b'